MRDLEGEARASDIPLRSSMCDHEPPLAYHAERRAVDIASRI